MSYAIESKKRKFERILESLTDSRPSPARSSPTAHNNAAASNTTTASTAEGSKRRRITPIGKLSESRAPSTASLTIHYLPSSRLAFLERLESFRQVTKWHVPSTCRINAVEWAKRGWVCQDDDTVSCPTCKERLHVDIDLDPTASEDREQLQRNEDKDDSNDNDPLILANAILDNLMNRYQEMIVSAHTNRCPWRRRGCDSSIQRIEGLLNTTNALESLRGRYAGIVEDGAEVPCVSSLPSFEAQTIDEQELKSLQLEGLTNINVNGLKLAICGWQKKEKDVVECRHCFRSLGLWLYRGSQPTVEHLDAIDNHLEYCPWRSSTAQDTVISLPRRPGRSSKVDATKCKTPGWMLVFISIVKENNRKRPPQSRTTLPFAELLDDDIDEGSPEQHSPEQRERKMKDLLRRIRDLKKPFNVKPLLRRKETRHP